MKYLFKKIQKYGIQNSFLIFLTKILSPHFSPTYELAKRFHPIVTQNINGYKMQLDLREDEGISKDLFLHKKREHLSTDFLINSNILNEGDFVLDAGANIGYYALLESNLVGNTGAVYAVEPAQKNFQALTKNVELNNSINVKVYNLAMGSKPGKEIIYINKKGNQSSMIYRQDENIKDKEEVNTTTVDIFIREEMKQSPKLIRMDVEGYEYAILEGMSDTLKTNPILFIEFHPPILTTKQKERICFLLHENGYNNFTIIRDHKCHELTLRGKIVSRLYKKIQGKPTKQFPINRVTHTDYEEFYSRLMRGNKSFHALIKRDGAKI
ncbi:MAG: FkbM family methyltransferase [Candidatus Paceibacterota bacterium]